MPAKQPAQPNTPRKLSTSRRKNGMENLSAQALVDLGNSFVVRGQPALAEKYLSQALDLAQRSKARRNEARARVSLASLRDQQNNPDEVVPTSSRRWNLQAGWLSLGDFFLPRLARSRQSSERGYEAALKGHETVVAACQAV